MKKKICPKCKNLHARTVGQRLASYCHSCHNEYIRNWRSSSGYRTDSVRKYFREYMRRWREQPEVLKAERARGRAYARANREKRIEYNLRIGRPNRFGADGSYSYSEWEEKLAHYHYKCAYCGSEENITRDHDVPLSRGGTNHILNIIPACSRCNSRKGNLTRTEFYAWMKKRGLHSKRIEVRL